MFHKFNQSNNNLNVRCGDNCYKISYYDNAKFYCYERGHYRVGKDSLIFSNISYNEGTDVNFYYGKESLDLNIERVSFIDGSMDLDKLFKRFCKLIVIS